MEVVKLKKILLLVLTMVLIASVSFADITNFPYNIASDQITEFTSGNGVDMKSGLTVDKFFNLGSASTVSTSATTNATITVAGSWQKLGTWQSVAISTVNAVVTASIPIGTTIYLQTYDDDHDIVFIETDNLSLGGTRTLDKAADILGIMKVAANKFIEVLFVSNE